MEKIRNMGLKTGYYSFYLGVIIEVLLVLIDKSAFVNPIEGRMFRLTFLLFLVTVCLTKYTKKEYLVIVLFFGLGVISYFATGRNEIIRFVMFIAACKNKDMQRCLKLVFYMTLIGCIVLVLLSLCGVLGAVSLTMDYGRGSEETRYVLGMGHPNALQCMVWALTTLGLYLYGKKMKWHHYLLLLAVNFVFFQLTDSRTSILVILLVMILSFCTDFFHKQKVSKVCAWIGMGATCFSIILSVLIAGNAYQVYNYDWSLDRGTTAAFWSKINNVLNGRIRILTENDGFEGTVSSWSLFSNSQSNYYFDLGWIRLFYWYGIIPACIFIMTLVFLMIYCYRKNHYSALIMIFSFALYSVIEAHAVSVYLARNYIFFLMGMYWSVMLCKTGRK